MATVDRSVTQIEVTRARLGGWDVCSRLVNGRGTDNEWFKNKASALRHAAQLRSTAPTARVLAEVLA
jgi:hypothetical protein